MNGGYGKREESVSQTETGSSVSYNGFFFTM